MPLFVSQTEENRRRICFPVLFFLVLAWIFSATPMVKAAGQPIPTPIDSLELPSSLREPVMPANPTLADGWLKEGLWEDMNCRVSRCHAADRAPVHLPIKSAASEHTAGVILAVLLGLATFSLALERWFANRNAESRPGTGSARPGFILHLHPPSIPEKQSRWRYTLGAGGLAVFLCLILGITGLLEMFFYIPTTDQAGLSIQTITYLVPFGGLIRGLHFWAAQALMAVSILHLLRVILTGSFVPPRQFNFLLGLVLLVLGLLLNFTGYVLRWDEGIRWALVVGTNLLKTIPVIGDQIYGFVAGGNQLGPATLIRFYSWHIFGLTLLVVLLTGWHIFRVRRDGGISAPPPNLREDTARITRLELLRREILAMLIAGAILIAIAMTFRAPLAAPILDANASAPLTEVRAPWFFLWVQQLLRFGDAFWMGIVIPLAALGALMALPYVFSRLPDEQKGRWFPRAGRLAQIIGASIIIGWLALTLLELLR